MYGYSVARKRGRYLVTIFIALLAFGCGGGGAVLEPDQAREPGTPAASSPPPAPPAAPPAAPGSPSPIVISTAGSRFNPATVTIQAGGAVTWQMVESRHNVTFGANKPQGGDVPDTEPGANVTRVFSAAGTFNYECTRHSGMTGQVIVQAAGSTAPPAAPPPPAPPASPGPTVVVTTPGSEFSPRDVELAPGGTVTWQFSGATHNVTFEDIAPPGGNIPNSAPGSSTSRTFPGEGDYDYFCTIHDGMKGRIRVR